MRVKLLHMKQLNTTLNTATSPRSFSILSSDSWWECAQAGIERDRSGLVENTVPFDIRKFRKFKPGILVEWNAPRTTSRGEPKFSKRISGKFLFHSILNWNFRKFWSNGTRPQRRLDTARYASWVNNPIRFSLRGLSWLENL